jgi:hypothetical protein
MVGNGAVSVSRRISNRRELKLLKIPSNFQYFLGVESERLRRCRKALKEDG